MKVIKDINISQNVLNGVLYLITEECITKYLKVQSSLGLGTPTYKLFPSR